LVEHFALPSPPQGRACLPGGIEGAPSRSLPDVLYIRLPASRIRQNGTPPVPDAFASILELHININNIKT
jgi:hypothetical protein